MDTGEQLIASATAGLFYWLHTEAAYMECVIEFPVPSAFALGLGIGRFFCLCLTPGAMLCTETVHTLALCLSRRKFYERTMLCQL